MPQEYNAESIKILTEDEAMRFDWNRAAELANEYKMPLEWIQRGFEASHRLGIETDYFESRYIYKKEVEAVPEFEPVFIELLRENRNKV